ncbi:MAG TPA: MFS transporter, partial [Chloroflexota bacterium]|nr:MFS transporter [Chloroflexota bacterium]
MSAAPTTPETVRVKLSSVKGRWNIVATALGSGMVFLDGSVVNVALPRIQSDLSTPLSGLQWIIDSYALFLAALLLVGGALGDAYGRKKAFLIGLTIFTVSSAACGFAPNAGALIAARAVQGVGGALLVPGSLAMIKATIAPEDSGAAIGLWAGLSGFTTALGPLLGGYFVGALSWRL